MEAIFINSIVIGGRLVKDTQFKSGDTWKKGRNTLAHDKLFRKDGNWEKETSFITITAWGSAAEALNKMAKGEKVIVRGRLDVVKWEQDGQERFAPEITADAVMEVERKQQQAQQANAPAETPF